MNKKSIQILAILIGIAVIGAGAYVLSQNDEPASQASNTQIEQPAEGNQPEDTEQTTANPENTGEYVNYEGGLIESTPGTKVLYFHADWCPQCRELESDILAKGVPEGVTIFKVDFDESRQLRQQYGVTLQTTLVKVDDQGNEISKYVAYDEPTLEAVEENLL